MPGQTIEDLLGEHKTHPKLKYVKHLEEKEKEKKEEPKPVAELTELSEKELRRIG